MRQFLTGVIVGVIAGAVCAAGWYRMRELPRVEENIAIGAFVNGAQLALMGADDEITDAVTADTDPPGPHMVSAIRHVRAWRGCGIAGLIKDWPGAYERLQAIEALHPGDTGWHANITASCTATDLGDAQQ